MHVFKRVQKSLDYLLQIQKKGECGVLCYMCAFEWAPRRMSSEKWKGHIRLGRQKAGVGLIAVLWNGHALAANRCQRIANSELPNPGRLNYALFLYGQDRKY